MKYFKNQYVRLCNFIAEKRGKKDFTKRCVFPHQLNYEHFKNDLYLVKMQSGNKAIYKRIDLCTYYSGTGQKDFKFKFIRYR